MKKEVIINNNPISIKLTKESKGMHWLKIEANDESLIEKVLIF